MSGRGAAVRCSSRLAVGGVDSIYLMFGVVIIFLPPQPSIEGPCGSRLVVRSSHQSSRYGPCSCRGLEQFRECGCRQLKSRECANHEYPFVGWA